MSDDDHAGLALLVVLLVVSVFVILALIAGSIVNQLLAPFPSIAGPLGAATALSLFIYLLVKTTEVLFG